MSAPVSRSTGSVARQAAAEVFPGAEVSEPWKLAGGAVHDSWGIDATVGGERRELVIRVSPAGRADYEKTRREFEVLKAAYAKGVLSPEPVGIGQCEGGEDYLVMGRLVGDTNPRQLLSSETFAKARGAILGQLARNLALIHTMTPADAAAAPNMSAPAPGEDPIAARRRDIEEAYRNDLLDPHPAIEWAFRWVDRQIEAIAEPGRPACVVHGDFRIGNMLYDENGLSGILDWEGTHVGEPEEDLTWLLTRVWRFGRRDLEAGGIGTREEWLRLYEEASGRSLDRRRIAAWEVLQNIRWCQVTMMQARAHLDGNVESHELAAIGRRTAETELEILRLTGVLEAARAG